MQDDMTKRDDHVEIVTDKAGSSVADMLDGVTALFYAKPGDQVTVKPENRTEAPRDKPAQADGKKPEKGTKAKPKKAAKTPDELGKGMTLEQMEAKRDELKTEAKSWTEAIDKRKRAERLEREKAEREKERRDALEFYRKYRPNIEMSKQMKLQSGRTVFEWIEQEVMKRKNGQEG